MGSIAEYFVLLFAGVVFVLAFALLVGVGGYKKMLAPPNVFRRPQDPTNILGERMSTSSTKSALFVRPLF